jgi:hypothetical protein
MVAGRSHGLNCFIVRLHVIRAFCIPLFKLGIFRPILSIMASNEKLLVGVIQYAAASLRRGSGVFCASVSGPLSPYARGTLLCRPCTALMKQF